MGWHLLLVAVFAAFASSKGGSIDHDKVEPFPQPEPITLAQKAAVKFKPSLLIKSGCHPYPVVNAAGDLSAGLKGTGKADGECEGSSLGSQVYSRSTWFDDKWAIMYAWYFPKDVPGRVLGVFPQKGLRHEWIHVIVWLDNPAVETPQVLTTSALSGTFYSTSKYPRSELIDGVTPMMVYDVEPSDMYHAIFQSEEKGEFQDLVEWEQLTDAALNSGNPFGEHAKVPFNDGYFPLYLTAARDSMYMNGWAYY